MASADKKRSSIRSRVRRALKPQTRMKYWYGAYYEKAKVDKRVILLESFHGKTISDSPLVCAREIERLWPGRFTVYYATNNTEAHSRLVRGLGLNVKLVDIVSREYARILATAGTIISNASLPIYYIRKEGQLYLQTWHGTPLKTLGKEMREGIESMYNVQHNFIQASHLLFPNEFTRRVIMRDYNLERLYTGQVIMCGYPRNQVFLQEQAAGMSTGEEAVKDTCGPDGIRSRYGLEGKTVYAYMPTWRGTSNHSIEGGTYYDEVREIFARLDAAMKDDQLMFVNFHPIIGGSFSFGEFSHIRPFPDDADNYEFLNAADALVTDYSSVFFDYSLTGKPVILFMYDYDKYMRDRGMYMDIRELPFRKIYDTDGLAACIASGACLGDTYEGSEYSEKFLGYDAPGNTEKLLRMLLDGADTGLEVRDYSFNLKRDVRIYAPQSIASESDLATLARVTEGRDAVVLMYKKWFVNGVGQMLHDRFNDAFDYVITTDTPPRTYLDQLLKKLGRRGAASRIHANDVKRCFGRLKADPRYIRSYGVLEEGLAADLKAAQLADVSVETGMARSPGGSSDGAGEVIIFRYDLPEGLRAERAAILDDRNALVWSREIGPDEAAGGFACFDLKEAIENLLVYDKEVCTPALICGSPDGSGEKKLVCFTDSGRTDLPKSWKDGNYLKSRTYPPAIGMFDLPRDYERVNAKRLLASPDEEDRRSAEPYLRDRETAGEALVPTLSRIGGRSIMQITLCAADKTMMYCSDDAVLKGYSFKDDSFRVRAFMKDWRAADVCGACISFDSSTEFLEIPAEYEAHDVRGGAVVTVTLQDLGNQGLQPLRWHCYIKVRYGGKEYNLRIRNRSRLRRAILKSSSAKSLITPPGDDGKRFILYPYLGLWSIFKLTYREETKYDTAGVRAKELTAMALYTLARPVLRRQENFIIYEKFSRTAQDNSFYFFRYCMTELPESERKKFWYVIDKSSPDYQYVREFEPRIIDFMSIKHMVLAMSAKLLISTDSAPHLYAWQTRPSFVYSRIRKRGVLFLQHGVTAMKRVDKLFGKNGSSPMKYFVATSETEQKIVTGEFGYEQDEAPITGFTRWDALEDRRDPADRFILIMPTWRVWLEDVSDEDFIASDYFRRYTELLTSERFTAMLEEADLRAVLYLHPKFARYIRTFRGREEQDESGLPPSSASYSRGGISSRIEMVSFGEKPLNDIMMRSSMLITDYSSVCWDMLYMDRPVIFYQFDIDKYLKAHGSYIDLRSDLPCPRAEDPDALLDSAGEYVRNGFVLQPEYEDKLSRFFSYRDRNNCQRTYRFLKEHEMK